jgi:proline iminopeptidase
MATHREETMAMDDWISPALRNRTAPAFLLSLALTLGATGCLDPDQPGNLVPKTVTEDPSLPRVQVNGTVLHAETFGNPANPTVIMLHGGPGNDYRGLLPLRALVNDGYHVVFWDQRGSGLSERHAASAYGWDSVLEDLRQIVDHYAPDPSHPVVFVGMSWGAMYATWFINQYGSYGGRIRGAVLSEPGAFTKAQLDAYMKRLTSVSFLDAPLNDLTWIGQFMSGGDQARADYMFTIQGLTNWPAVHCDDEHNPEPRWRSGAVAAKSIQDLAVDGFDWTTNLKSFTPKVLFLRSELNEANRLQDQQELAAAYASAEIITIPGTGHCLIWEKPTEYLQQVRTYFQAIGFAGGQP